MILFLWIMTISVVSIQFVNHWFFSKGRLRISYSLSIVAYSLYIIIETIIALRDPAQLSILLFNVVNFWGLLMAIKGLRRLRMERVNSER
jgi:hypothetical protein